MTPHRVFFLLSILSVTASTALTGEPLKGTFRGEVLPDGPAVALGTEELVLLSLPPATRFTRALEIELQIPREVLPYRSSLAVTVYQYFSAPKGKEPASGEKLAVEVLPPNSRFYLQAPLVPKAGLKASVDTAVLKTLQFDRGFPLGLMVSVLDKDAPVEVLKAQFQVKTHFLNSNLGALSVVTPNLSPEDRKRLRLLANGVTQPSEGTILLEPGLYQLEATLSGFSGTSVNVSVGQAKVTEVTLVLDPESPTVVFEAPEGASIVLDGKKVIWSPVTAFPVDVGPHNVQLSLGNNLVSQTFEIPRGGRFKIRLNLELLLEKE